MHALWLVNQLWVIVTINPRKNRASSELLYKSNRPQVSMGYINNSCHLARKYARIFVRRHYLFREVNSFPRAKLEENCELRGTDNVQGQISEHIFAPNGDYCLYYPSNLFATRKVLKIGEYSRIFPSFSCGIFGHVTRLGQSRVSKKIWWIIKADKPLGMLVEHSKNS